MIPTVRELRNTLKFTPHEINSSIKYFAEHTEIDFDVFLPSKGINLQRDFVWSLHQKRELIWSILTRRNIPRMAMLGVAMDNGIDDKYQVIDGKQRLSAMLDFFNNKYTLLIDNEEYLFRDLPKDYQAVIGGYNFAYYIAHDGCGADFTDQDKIDWFMYINFAGTPQDQEHFEKLK